MNTTGEHPVEVLWRMQQEAIASGHELPEREQDEQRWGGLAFGVGDLKLVTELTSVIDVLGCPVITPVPGTQPWLKGVCNVRGNLYSVVDLGVYLNVAPPIADGDGRLLVLNDKELGCTLIVSRIFGLRYFIAEQERQDISILDRALQPYAEKAFMQGDQIWGVLDFSHLVAAESFLKIERTALTK